MLKRSGRNFQLLVLFSIEQQLRANEKQVWQRLIRVLNHEVRNSLAPIYSMTESLQEMKLMGPLTPEQESLEKNILQVIEKRSLQLLEFVENYSAFSKLAPEKMAKVYPKDIVQRMQAIFPKLSIELNESVFPFLADAGQLEQALINLIKNAFEACESSKSSPEVQMLRQKNKNQTTINNIDSGQGIAINDNLFVPFYSTKPQGSWYRFFGAGEQMVLMAEQGSWQPTIITLVIFSVLSLWSAYAFSAAGLIIRLPFIRLALSLITLVYLVRGLAGFTLMSFTLKNNPMGRSPEFWLWSSLICLTFGIIHAIGLKKQWATL